MIKVLVVDDSAVMRAFLSRVISAQPDMELVGVAPDPIVAIERIRRSVPDVITLDVEMPGMNGLDFLQKLMAVRPSRVLMISSLTRQGTDTTIRALELGAVDFYPKPASHEELDGRGQEIADKIRGAAQARVARHRVPAPVRNPVAGPSVRGPAAMGQVIGIGASTGGVEALREILTELPPGIPPILIAQHMLPGFTETFARRLDSICAITVKQAENGEVAHHGVAYIAPGGRHLTLARRAGGYVLRVTDDPPVNLHRPSVDMLFRSMAGIVGAQATGVLLTGMGADGAEAMLELSRTGAMTIAQDEASCVVFGMPRQAIALGAAREVLPLGEMAQRLTALCSADAAPRASPLRR
jgi:two-component system chemotaxis response regulator CheB